MVNVVGGIDWDGYGLLGLEDFLDVVLVGIDGLVIYDCGLDGVVIFGSYWNWYKVVYGFIVVFIFDNDI